jgi:hypothetical protein
MAIARKVIMSVPGATDTYDNAEVTIHPNGDVSIVTKNSRTWKRDTYAHGRWTKVHEEGRVTDE